MLPAACRTASTGASSREHNGTGHERQSRQLRADERKRYARDVDANTAQRTSDSLRKAERCDAEGRHAEALNHLAAAARNSDVEALTRLGKRLLVGDRAPHLPNDGAQLLQDAAALGGAEAAAVLSVLYAVGASKRHGLPEALESLVLAAERGWAPAQAQLRVLLADAGGADDYDGDGADLDWRRKAAEIDLSTWQTPRGGTDLNTSPRVCLLSGFLGDAVCSWLIEKARGRLTRARVYEALSKRVTVSETRTNTAATMNLLDTDLVCVLTQVRMAACAGVPFRHLEPLSVLHYDEGEQITEHFDFVDPNVPDYEQEIALRGQRIVTFLVYLNDDYDHGETEFPELAISHKGRRGDGLFFVNALPDGRADVRTLHAGRPPSRGEKWIVSQFVRNRPLL